MLGITPRTGSNRTIVKKIASKRRESRKFYCERPILHMELKTDEVEPQKVHT